MKASNFARQVTNLASLMLALALTGCITMEATHQEGKTPLQMKMMQTRKYQKAFHEVVEAANFLCTNLGGMSGGNNASNILRAKGDDRRYLKGVCYLQPKMTEMLAFGGINYGYLNKPAAIDVTAQEQSPTSTIVRLVVKNRNNEVITSEEIYRKFHNQIGEQIFVEGLPLDPAEQL